MRVSETLLLADRIIVAVRWFTLLGLALLTVVGGVLSIPVAFLFVLAALWNSVLAVLSIIARRLPDHPVVSIVADLLTATLLFLFTRTVTGSLLWAGLLPVVSAAFYFGLLGGLSMTAVVIIEFGVLGLIDAAFPQMVSAMSLPSLMFLVAGGVAGYASQELSKYLLEQRILEIGHKEEAELDEQEETQQENQRVDALYGIVSTLNSTLNYQRVLEMALDLSSEALTDPTGAEGQLVSAFLLFGTEGLYVGSARGFASTDMRVTLPGAQGVIAQAIESGSPIIGGQPTQDPELRRIVALHQCKAAYCFPLRAGLDVFGVMLYGHTTPNYFNESRCEVLEIIGRQAQVAIQNARLYQELEDDKRRLTEIHEEAQKKLARNLHDGPTQSVAAIAMRVNFARRMLERDAKTAGEELFKIEELARRTTKEIRHMLFTLRPLVLESSGLIAALQSLADKMRENYSQNVIIEADEQVIDRIEMGKQGVVFYIAEEAVNNARKHAEAESIWVRLGSAAEEIVLLEIKDNGVGFNVGAVDASYEHRGSLGMVNMRERTQLVNGVLQLESQEGQGTRIRVWIPLTEDAAERLRRGTQT